MSLVTCPECQKEVSSQAFACPQCAYPYPGKQGLCDEKLQACAECGGVISKKAQACPHCGISCTENPKDTKETIVAEEITDETWLCSHCGTPYTRKVRKPSEPIAKVEEQHADSQKPPVTDGRGLSFAPNVPNQKVRKPSEPIAKVEEQHADSQKPPVTDGRGLSFAPNVPNQKVRKPSEPIAKVEEQHADSQKPPVTDGRGLSFAPNVPKLDPAAPLAGRHRSPLWFPPATAQERTSSPSPQRKKSTLVVGMVLVFLIVLSLVLWVLWQPNGTNPFDLLPKLTWSIDSITPSLFLLQSSL